MLFISSAAEHPKKRVRCEQHKRNRRRPAGTISPGNASVLSDLGVRLRESRQSRQCGHMLEDLHAKACPPGIFH
jgi:hypothetical protein